MIVAGHSAPKSRSQATVQPTAIWCTPAWFTGAQHALELYLPAVQTGWQMLEGFDLCVPQDLLMRKQRLNATKNESKNGSATYAAVYQKNPSLSSMSLPFYPQTDTCERRAPARRQRDQPPKPASCHTQCRLTGSIWKCLNPP